MLSTSSDGESRSEAEGPSEQVAEQLASLKERVSTNSHGPTHKWPSPCCFVTLWFLS